MKHGKGSVFLRYLIVGIDDPQLPRVLKGVRPEAEHIEEAPQGPDVCLLVDQLVTVEVDHFRGTVHWSGVTLDLDIWKNYE